MRHLAIYATRWPERMPTDGTPAFAPLSRENRGNTPAHLVQKSLPISNHKVPSAPSASRSASAVEKRPLKRQRTVEAKEQAPPPKRQKITTSASGSASTATGRPRGRPPKNKVGMSTKARELLGVSERRSGRARVPSLKLRESEPPSKGKGSPIASSSKAPLSTASTSSSSSSNSDSSDSSLSAPHPEANDRHHLRSFGSALPPEPTTPVSIKTEAAPKLPTPKSLAVASQPREANGRFGKKATTNGRYQRKFCVGAGGRKVARGRRTNKVRPKAIDAGPNGDGEVGAGGEVARVQAVERLASASDGALSQLPKRSHYESGDEDEDEERSKRRKMEADEEEELQVQIKVEGEEADLSGTSYEEEAEEEEEEEPQPFRRPLLTASKSGAGLLSRPNPLTFARRKWTSSVPPEDPEEIPVHEDLYLPQSSSTEDDTDLPVTPEDDRDHPVVIVDKSGDADPAESDQQEDLGNESDESTERMFVRPRLMVKSAYGGSRSLTFKPNPLNMSRRRWGPTPSAGADPDESGDLSEGKAPSRPTVVSFTDLFEADPDGARADAEDPEPVHGSVDPDVSSEEVSPFALHQPCGKVQIARC